MKHYAKCNKRKKNISYKTTNSYIRQHVKTNRSTVDDVSINSSNKSVECRRSLDANGNTNAIRVSTRMPQCG